PKTVDGVGIPGHAHRPRGDRGSTTHQHSRKLPCDYARLRGGGLCLAHRRPCTVWSAIEGRSVTLVAPSLAEVLEERPFEERGGQDPERTSPARAARTRASEGPVPRQQSAVRVPQDR